MGLLNIKGYEIEKYIDEGGFATIYRAFYKGEGSPPYGGETIAVKALHPWKSDKKTIRDFEREAKIALTLDHPNVIKTYDFLKEGGFYVIVMEDFRGKNLSELIKDGKDYSLSQLLFFLKEIGKGLSYIHNHGIIHKDIKPQNVLLSEDLKVVKITDFGVAKPESLWRRDITPAGTVTYASPEQKAGLPLDRRSDIYSFGKLMFELLVEKIPFHSVRREDRAQKKFAIRFGAAPRIINPNIPKPLEKIILKSTKKRPSDRYQSMEEVLSALIRAEEIIV